MKRLVFFFGLCLLASSLYAQSKLVWGLSPKAGTVISVLTSNLVNTSNPRYGLLTGVAGDLEFFKSKIILQSEILFTQTGGREDNLELIIPDGGLTVRYNTGLNTRVSNLELPVLVGRRFSKKENMGFRMMLGPSFNYIIRANNFLDTEPPSGVTVSRRSDIRNDLNTFQLNMMLLLGYDWDHLGVELRVLPSISDLYALGIPNDQRVSALQVALGWDLL